MSADVKYSDTSPKYKGKGKKDSTVDIAPGRYFAITGRNPGRPTPKGLCATVINEQIIIENREGIVPETAKESSGNKLGSSKTSTSPTGSSAKSKPAT